MTWYSSSLGSFSISSSATKTAYPQSGTSGYQYMFYWDVAPSKSGTLTATVTSNSQSAYSVRMFLARRDATFSSSDGSISPYIDKDYHTYSEVSGDVTMGVGYRVWIGYNTTAGISGTVTVSFSLEEPTPVYTYDYYWDIYYYSSRTSMWDYDSYYNEYSSGGTRSHTFTIPNSTPTKGGYNFLGWSTSSSATTPSYYPGGTYSVTATMDSTYVYSGEATLYAVWEEIITYDYYWDITYVIQGSVYDTDSYSYTYDTGGNRNHSFRCIYDEPTRQGYTFLGWANSSSASTPNYTGGDYIPVTATLDYGTTYSGSKTVYAVWQKNSISNFTWTGSSSGDNTAIAQGQPVTNMTASRWNSIGNKINEVRNAYGQSSISFTRAYSGNNFLASMFNEIRSAIANLTGHGSLPSSRSQGDEVLASQFNGSGSLKSALNSAIDYYNDN